MRYQVLATDYDGTLAHHGAVDEATIAALVRARESGRKLVLVSGRELEDLLGVFPRTDLFDLLVLENGAIVVNPRTGEVRLIGEAPPPSFLEALRVRNVAPVSRGRVIVATWEPHDPAVLDAIRELGLELQVIFNKGAVMILPSGINKATGLSAALTELGIDAANVVGIGDAENDHALLSMCGCGVAVANALPTLRERADLVTRGDHGAGVQELVAMLLADDLAGVRPVRTAGERAAAAVAPVVAENRASTPALL